MPVEIIGKLKQKNNGTWKIVDAEHVDYDGSGQFSIKDKIDDMKPIHIGDAPPDDTNKIWIDNSDQQLANSDSDIVNQIKTTLANYNITIDNLKYALEKELDPGYFKGVLPGTDTTVTNTTLDDGAKGTVGHILLKRGLKEDIESLQEGEFGFCLDTEELYIGNKGRLRLIAKVGGISDDSGSSNVTGEYVELVTNSGKKFRITINDEGQLIILNSEVDTSTPAVPDDSGRYKGLIINKVYGGGAINTNTTPVSHGFIELYNSTDTILNLNGLAIQYGEYMSEWKMLPLRGEIKPLSSFLIRCAQHSTLYRRTTRFKITDFDMSWDIPISEFGYKVYLNIPNDITKPTTFTNPANTDGSWTKEAGYINLFAVGGEDTSRGIDGYEKGYLQICNKYRMIKRIYSTDVTITFASTGDNSVDLEYLDMREANIDLYMPRSSHYGQWDHYYNQPKLDTNIPNIIFIGFGKDGDTSRTFTWQSTVTKNGFLKYKLKSNMDWITVSTNKKFLAHPDVDVTIHSVIIRNLVPGIYIYKAGEEGHWSDEYEFEVRDVKDITKTIKMLWTSDQQGWDDIEYSVWGKANDYIIKNETFDFMLNTGDISQNGNRSYEWREYYEYSKNNLPYHVHMTCVGNNDLVDKLDPIAYTYYSTAENCPYPSVYSFNYGFCHFISLNSNFPIGNATVTQQIAFIKDDMDFSKHPENKKRWTIVYMHESPYTVIRNSKMLDYIDTFNAIGIDLVLCGHHHRYTRSYRMGALDRTDPKNIKDVINNDLSTNGTYYVMLGSCGMKQDGKTVAATVAPWRADLEVLGEPQYVMWEISYDKMVLHCYRLTNILPLKDNIEKEVIAIPFDEGNVITKN